jgi:hypothetical protein
MLVSHRERCHRAAIAAPQPAVDWLTRRTVLSSVAVGKTVAPTRPLGNTDAAATRASGRLTGLALARQGPTSAQLLTGVENGSEAVARGFPDSLVEKQHCRCPLLLVVHSRS